MDTCTLERCLCHETQTPITEAVYGKKPRSKKKEPRGSREAIIAERLDPATRLALLSRLPRRMQGRWGL